MGTIDDQDKSKVTNVKDTSLVATIVPEPRQSAEMPTSHRFEQILRSPKEPRVAQDQNYTKELLQERRFIEGCQIARNPSPRTPTRAKEAWGSPDGLVGYMLFLELHCCFLSKKRSRIPNNLVADLVAEYMGLYSLGAVIKYTTLYSWNAKSVVKYLGLYSVGARTVVEYTVL